MSGPLLYIGKGTGNRVFAHANEAIDCPQATDKLERIRAIASAGKTVGYAIVRHGLTEEVALEIESVLIDWEGIGDLANAVVGHHAERRGCMSVPDIIATYSANPVSITEPGILVTVNRLFRRNMDASQLYEITRGNWVINERRKDKARYGIAVSADLFEPSTRSTGGSARMPAARNRSGATDGGSRVSSRRTCST